MGKFARMAAVLAAALSVSSVLGGEIVFKNGDRLTGEVTQLGDGKLKIKSAVAGEITVSLSDVATFSTDAPVEIKLKDGNVLKQQVQKSEEPGKIQTVPSESGVAGSQLTLDQFATINEPKAPAVKWTGNIKAGALLTRGNSDTDAANVSGEAVRRSVDDRFSLTGQYLYGRQKNDDTGEKTTSTDNWTIQGKYDYFITKKLYLYGVAKFERDRIADLSLRAQPGVGVGYQWIESAKANFSTEAGLGFTYEDYKGGDSNSYINARAAYHYDRVIRDNVKFIHNVEYLPSLEDINKFNLNADAGIRVALTEKFFTEFKVEWKYNSEPAEDASDSDLRYILAVGWQF